MPAIVWKINELCSNDTEQMQIKKALQTSGLG